MLFYCGIDVSESIDVNKTRIFKECNTCHNQYLIDKGFKF